MRNTATSLNIFKIFALSWFALLSACNSHEVDRDSIPISSIPFTISKSNARYYLTSSLTTANEGGNAITIEPTVHDVVVDLNGYSLSGNVGAGTFVVGIRATDSSKIEIRNGTISGFFYGIRIADTSLNYTNTSGIVIENIQAQNNTFRAIRVKGSDVKIRNNVVTNTGGTTVYSDSPFVFAVESFGPGTVIENNVIADTHTSGALGEAGAISLTDGGTNAVVKNNELSNSSPADGSYLRSMGIWVGGNTVNPTQAAVLENKISNMDWGVAFSSPTSGIYFGNKTHNCEIPYFNNSTEVVDGGENL